MEKRNPYLADDETYCKAAKNRCFGTMWLLNSNVPKTVTDNLVQAYCTGQDNYPANVTEAYSLATATKPNMQMLSVQQE